MVNAGAHAPCRRNKPWDLDLAELTELARNVPEGAQERIERYVAQEVERRTSTVLLLPRRPDSASMYSAAGSLPGTSIARGVRRRHRIVLRVRRPAREPALPLSKGHRRDPPGPIVRKILTHLRLPTAVVTRRPCDVWQVRGPPGELVPGDFDAVDPPDSEDLDPPFWDDPLNDAGI